MTSGPAAPRPARRNHPPALTRSILSTYDRQRSTTTRAEPAGTGTGSQAADHWCADTAQQGVFLGLNQPGDRFRGLADLIGRVFVAVGDGLRYAVAQVFIQQAEGD
jgi:hypothetical protein